MFKLTGLTIVAALLAPAFAAPQSACLPKSVFVKNHAGESPPLSLGYIDNILTLCAYERVAENDQPDKPLGCWTVDPTTGVLGTSAATAIPGLGRRIALDSKNCFDGYCAPGSANDKRVIFATSTDGSHAALMNQTFAYIFTTNTKAKVAEIDLTVEISGMPWDLLYSSDTLFVVDVAAGPGTGVYAFKDDGSHTGPASRDVDYRGLDLNIFRGGYGILGPDTVAFAEGGLKDMMIVTGANAKTIKRAVSYSPCTADQFGAWVRTDEIHNRACNRVLAAKYAPYVDTSLAQLPSGEIMTTLSGPAQGQIAVLDPVGLTKRRQLNLRKCP